MIYVLIGMSLFFVGLGFIVTENNSKYLLSGYNTMGEEDRKKVDIKSYIPYFRRFHVYLGISFLIIGLGFHYFIGENAAGVFLGVYPVISYMYFIWTSARYSKGLSTKWNKIGIFILAITLVFVVGIFVLGFKEDKLVVTDDKIQIDGSYGEELYPSEIMSVELVNELPGITSKTNGFALGSINKGYFKTHEGEIIKLVLNAQTKPVILFIKKNGQKVFYSAKDKSNEDIYNDMKKAFPDVMYKQ